MMRFMFLRDKNNQPVGCLAFMFDRPNHIVYGMSVLNPKDKFNRAIAREVAMLRMNMAERYRGIAFGESLHTMHEVSKAIMQDVAFDNERAPARARKAAKLWLVNNQKHAELAAKIE